MIRFLACVILMTLLISLPGCASPGSRKPATAPVQRYTNVDAEEFERLSRQPGATILDVRTADEYASGHLPGALSMDVRSPDFVARVSQLDKSKTYLLHCRSGMRSTSACKLLADMGFPHLYNLTGGLGAWQSAGKPVVK
jgi:rhodanese-related sulfurtransferase